MNGALQKFVSVDSLWSFDLNVEGWQSCNHTVKESDSSGQSSQLFSELSAQAETDPPYSATLKRFSVTTA